jgi:hypothetical protein
MMRRLKLRLKVEIARFDWCATADAEHPAGAEPGPISLSAVDFLLLSAKLECGDAQVRKRERCLGGLSFGFRGE